MRISIRVVRHSCILAFLHFCISTHAAAQSFESVGIRAQGMGGAFVAAVDDATVSWWNPAGLASLGVFSSIIEYDHRDPADPTFEGVGTTAIAMAFPGLALSYYRLSINQIRTVPTTAGTTAGRQDPGSGVIGVGRLTLNQFGATVGQSIGNHFVLASTLKLVHGNDATTGDLDIGAMARFGVLRAGVTVRNVKESDLDNGTSSVTLTRAARAGAAVVAETGGAINALTLAVDADITTQTTLTGDARRIAAGIEAWTWKRRIGLRGGVSGSVVGQSRLRPAIGASFAVRSGTYMEGHMTEADIKDAPPIWGVGLRVTF